MPPTPPPTPPPTEWPLPKLNIRVEDLAHPGAAIFFDTVHPTTALRAAVLASFEWLYATPACAPTNVLSILLVLRPMEGVAHTFGSHSEKEIHFSLDHIVNSASRARAEILGVLVHEVVHCYQHNANGTAPGGLIEGVADFVRLHADLAPPHWKRAVNPGDTWDAGYQTTAYFLEWLDDQSGAGTVRALNATLQGVDYEEAVFERLAGAPVRELWRRYKAELSGGENGDGGSDEGFTLV
ncbi:plant basic secretory protein [Mycena rosella]|uniref:Plant basic secretory protein n=1 Tax=Mycena rosella TaxID=1033263 RepID=A0AAD7C9L7_MYCRO|nr:plant basic secretory protein [Mycena rosella]